MTKVINMRDTAAVAAAKADGTFVYVGRERFTLGEWGNRYSHLPSPTRRDVVKVATRQEAVAHHQKEVLDDEYQVARIRKELAGKTLTCWCCSDEWPWKKPDYCHAQTLADIADGRLG